MADPAAIAVLSLVNWAHLAATVVWIGAMTTNILILLPAVNEALGPGPATGKLMASMTGRFRPVVYLSILTLTATGFLMTALNKNYLGPLVLGNLWTVIMAVKHVVVAALVVLAVYALEVLAPKVAQVAAKGPSPELARLQRLQMNVARTGFALGVLILLFTGIATAVSALP